MKTELPRKNEFVFFGTPYVARDTLDILVSRGYTPSLIVTSPDRPRGRGMQMTPTEVKAWALVHDIPVLTPEKITPEVIEQIASYDGERYGYEYAIVVAYGKILPLELINTFTYGVINIHYSLLPKYRGASPVESALLNGETHTGVSLQKMVYELDAGDVIASEEVEIGPDETTRELRARLIPLGANLLADTLPAFFGSYTSMMPFGTPQDPALVTKCTKMRKEDGEIQLTDAAERNWRKYRAYAEWPGTYFFIDKDDKRIRVKIAKASFTNGRFDIERVVPEGKGEQPFADFAKNNNLPL